jgi:predicted metal-dependent peptidase
VKAATMAIVLGIFISRPLLSVHELSWRAFLARFLGALSWRAFLARFLGALSWRAFLARFLGAGIRAQEEVAPRTSRSRMSLDLRWSLLATRIDGVARAREQNERQIPKQ